MTELKQRAKAANERLRPYRHRLLLVGLAGIGLLVILSNLTGLSFNSDDVAQQAMVHNLLAPRPHVLELQPDTFIFKFPVYLLLNDLTQPSRGLLVFESILFNVVMIGLLYVWWKKFAPRAALGWLIFAWLIASGAYWMAVTVNPNTRNIELPLMLLFVFFVVDRLEKLAGKAVRTLALHILGFGVLGGLLIYNDPYILFFALLPLCVAVLIDGRIRSRIGPTLFLVLMLAVSLAVYRLSWLIGAHYGLKLTRYNELADVSSSIITPRYFPVKTLAVVKDYLMLFGVGAAGSIWQWLAGLFGLGAIGLAILAAWRSLVRPAPRILDLWMGGAFLISLFYVILTGLPLVNTYRYLILLVPLTALLAARGAIYLQDRHVVRRYRVIAVIMSVALVVNLLVAAIGLIQNASPNNGDAQLATVLNKNGVTAAYGDYWLATSTYYLDDYRTNVLPTVCSAGRVYKDPVLLDAARFNTPPGVTGIIVSPSIAVPAGSSYLQSPGCTVRAAVRQFGNPHKIVQVSASVSLLVYDRTLSVPWR